jgi:integrase
MRRAGCRRCAFIIAVLAYAGLRPQELLALEWDDVLTDVAKLFIARKNVDGQVLSYLKSGRRHRNRRHRRVDLFEPLAAHLRVHRLRSGVRRGLVIARADGAPWRKHDWDNWRKRVWQPLAVEAGLGELVTRGAAGRRATRAPTVRPARLVRVAADLGGADDARGGAAGRARRRRVRDVLRADL